MGMVVVVLVVVIMVVVVLVMIAVTLKIISNQYILSLKYSITEFNFFYI